MERRREDYPRLGLLALSGGVPASVAGRVPALDGVRALAIAFVIASHCVSGLATIGIILGHLGVTIFLVLSGYLITNVMLSDEHRNGSLRIGRFYARRALRILPALYVFLAALAILGSAGTLPMPDRQTWLASILYYRNLSGHGWDTGHLWSLSLEEQFYLTWPVAFVLTRRFRMPFIAVIVTGLTAWRVLWIQWHGDGYALTSRFDLRVDTFLIGAAFAIGTDWKWVRSIPPLAFAVSVPLCYFNIVPLAARSAALAFLIGALIRWLIENPNCLARRLLSARWPVRVGICSYSLYLWQQIFVGPEHFHWAGLPVLAVVVTCSYLLVERPFLRWKDRLGSVDVRKHGAPRAAAAMAGFSSKPA
jgi:peptidoglycan/LPS O-acetylase OafA/YrhL